MADLNSSIVRGNLRVTDEINASSVKENGSSVITSANIGSQSVNYATSAGSATSASLAASATSATTASKLSTNAGSTTQPVYFSGGVPVATTYSLSKSVPSDAVFTDTNTWRPIKVNGSSAISDSSTTVNYTGSGLTSVSYSSGTITISSSISSGNVTTALGYTPVNKAGDTMSGSLTLSNTTGPELVISKEGSGSISASQTIYGISSIKYSGLASKTLSFPSSGGTIATEGFVTGKGYITSSGSCAYATSSGSVSNSLKIQGGGADVASYNGSAAKTFNFAASTTAGAFTISDGTTTKTIQLAGTFTDNNYYHTPSYSSGLSIATGTGVNALYVPDASTSQKGVVQYTSTNLSTWINTLDEGTSAAQRDDYIVAQYAGGGTTTTTYHRRKLSNIFKALNSSDITTALGFTPGTVTSVSAGTGLSISGTASVNPTINIASGYKLLSTTDWNSVITTSNIGSQSVSYATSAGSATSATSASSATTASSLAYSSSPVTPTSGNLTVCVTSTEPSSFVAGVLYIVTA